MAGLYNATTGFTIVPFSDSFSVCGSFTYTVSFDDVGDWPEMISYNDLTQTFTVDVANIPESVSYNFKITGSLPSPYPASFTTVTIHLKGCDVTEITVPFDMDPSYTFTYGDSTNTIQITNFVDSFEVCGSYTYSCTISLASDTDSGGGSADSPGPRRALSGDTLPFFARFYASTKKLVIDTFSLFTTNQYSVEVSATLSNGITNTLQFDLNIIGCEPAVLTPPDDETYYFNIGDLRLEIPLSSIITITHSKCMPYQTIETLTYSKVASLATLPDSSIATSDVPACMIQSNYYHELWV